MKVIDNEKYFELSELKEMLKQKSWKDSWNVETIYINSFIEFLDEIEIIEEDTPIEKIYGLHHPTTDKLDLMREDIELAFETIDKLIDKVNELEEGKK